MSEDRPSDERGGEEPGRGRRRRHDERGEGTARPDEDAVERDDGDGHESNEHNGDVESLIAQRRAEHRRGAPGGREALPGRARTVRLLVVTAALVLASAVVLAVVLLVAG